MPRIKPPRSQEQEDPPVLVEDHTLPTEDVEIELSGDDTGSAEIEVAPQRPQPGAAAAASAPADNALQRALDAQARAEELQRQTLRERDDAVRQARERDEELTRERGEREDAQYNSVLTAIAAEQSALDKAEADYAAFAAAAEWGNAGKAQRLMAAASARLDRLEDNKLSFDAKREAAKTDPPPARQPAAAAPLDFESKLAAISIPDAGKTWLRNHPEFVNDPAQNKRIGSVHNFLTDVEGIEPFSPAYFDALDARLGFKNAAPAPEPEPQPQPRQRSIPMSAPVSRDVPSPSGQRQSSSKIVLTAEERAIARTSFTAPNMTNAEKELLYAKNKQKLAQQKANGQYQERTS